MQIAVFSFSDLRSLTTGSLGDAEAALDKPVMWLLSEREGDRIIAPPRLPVVVAAHDSFATALAVLVSEKLHRTFIVDSGMHPIGCVSETDVLHVATSPVVLAHRSKSASLQQVVSDAASELTGRHVASSMPADRSSSRLETLLRTTTAREFASRDGVRVDKIIDVATSASLKHVLALMTEHNISALPVYRT